MIILFDRLLQKIVRIYRNKIFLKKINCEHNYNPLVGKITLINNHIKIGKNVTIYPDVMFFGDGDIEIGNNVSIGNGTIIYASKNGGVTIGNDTQIAAQCYIIDMDHSFKKDTLIRMQENIVAHVDIGNDVWIAANCTILKGSIIKHGAVIGAKSLVKGIVESNSVSVGIPAKHIKYR